MTDLDSIKGLFLTAEKFYKEVDDVVWKDDIGYMEAVMIVCDVKGIDPEDLVKLKLISPLLMTHLHKEACENGQIKNTFIPLS